MKIFSAEQIKAWDKYTISHTDIDSLALMERAATACYAWLDKFYPFQKQYAIFCGIGNNGGDGLVIARLLKSHSNEIKIFVIGDIENATDDFKNNFQQLQQRNFSIQQIAFTKDIPALSSDTIIIDCIFGTGLNRAPEGLVVGAINALNNSGCGIISVDIPSGLFTDKTSKGNTIINAKQTLTFQSVKLAFLLAENENYVGQMHVLDIDLDPKFCEAEQSNYFFTEENEIKKLLKPRKLHAHKGNFGHTLLIGGSHGKMGAMILCSKACLHSGVGLLTVSISETENSILQISVPEAMTYTDDLNATELQKYTTLGIGPGWGTSEQMQRQLLFILENYKTPIVIDADALNCLSLNKDWLKLLPAGSILTPHPKEFERLFGKADDDFARLKLAKEQASLYDIVVVLKGHYTAIITPDGEIHFNSTGNPGMAKGGSGDALTGIVTSFLAQGYAGKDAARLAVYVHGLAGDIAAKDFSMWSMTASDIIASLGNAFQALISDDNAVN